MIRLVQDVIRIFFSVALISSTTGFGFPEKQRPFRLGVYKLNTELDGEKPLAQSDGGGFVIRGDLFVGSFDQKWLRAYNFKTRQTAWFRPIDGEVTAPPLLIENTVYTSTRSGKLYAHQVASGDKVWEISLDSFSERPLVASNGTIYVVTAGQVAYAIEASSGKRIWVHDAGFPDMVIVRRSPAPVIHEGRLIFGLGSGELVGLKLEDGKRLWKYNPLYQESRFKDYIGEMLVNGGKLLVSRYDGLVALIDMTQERQVVWQDKQASVSTSTFRSGRYYVGLTSGDIIAYDSSFGRVLWKTSTGPTPAFLVVSETNLYAVSSNGRLTALDIGTGDYLWADQLGSRIAVPPIVSGNRMYVSTGLRNIYGYEIK